MYSIHVTCPVARIPRPLSISPLPQRVTRRQKRKIRIVRGQAQQVRANIENNSQNSSSHEHPQNKFASFVRSDYFVGVSLFIASAAIVRTTVKLTQSVLGTPQAKTTSVAPNSQLAYQNVGQRVRREESLIGQDRTTQSTTQSNYEKAQDQKVRQKDTQQSSRKDGILDSMEYLTEAQLRQNNLKQISGKQFTQVYQSRKQLQENLSQLTSIQSSPTNTYQGSTQELPDTQQSQKDEQQEELPVVAYVQSSFFKIQKQSSSQRQQVEKSQQIPNVDEKPFLPTSPPLIRFVNMVYQDSLNVLNRGISTQKLQVYATSLEIPQVGKSKKSSVLKKPTDTLQPIPPLQIQKTSSLPAVEDNSTSIPALGQSTPNSNQIGQQQSDQQSVKNSDASPQQQQKTNDVDTISHQVRQSNRKIQTNTSEKQQDKSGLEESRQFSQMRPQERAITKAQTQSAEDSNQSNTSTNENAFQKSKLREESQLPKQSEGFTRISSVRSSPVTPSSYTPAVSDGQRNMPASAPPQTTPSEVSGNGYQQLQIGDSPSQISSASLLVKEKLKQKTEFTSSSSDDYVPDVSYGNGDGSNPGGRGYGGGDDDGNQGDEHSESGGNGIPWFVPLLFLYIILLPVCYRIHAQMKADKTTKSSKLVEASTLGLASSGNDDDDGNQNNQGESSKSSGGIPLVGAALVGGAAVVGTAAVLKAKTSK
eukprot:TRINITY_DN5830_c0_g1_i4.p1 TRINITY_DN5830_c0_g1~~TRINITY_DN5830_c0_g1_i4.p1  ORF type:complete len:703 (-),score=59.93 TRINITY_DN5830_c0_g1_i4:488-2596(-)